LICLVAAGLVAALGVAQVELRWTHSVERTVWRETWRAQDSLLHLDQAAIRGTGAGMEMPADARLVDGWYLWKPRLSPQHAVLLTRSGATADYDLCVAADCQPLRHWLPADAPLAELRACS
jgi:hypothetical protein